MFYDPDGIVDRCADYLLEKMTGYLDGLYIVCNGRLREPEKLLRHTERLYVRPNTGFDAAAWQYLLREVIPRRELAEYDELILWNDTFYGPVYPLEELFGKMERTDCDFWGISAHAKSTDPMGTCPLGYWPAHIQTYFWAVRSRMFLSPSFAEYWDSLPLCASFEEAVGRFEAVFTRHFSDLGFRWAVFAGMEETDAREPAKLPHYIFDSYEMLVRCRSPFYKKKNFTNRREGSLAWNSASFTRRSLQYIASCTDYDETMIYDNILRLYDSSLLTAVCGLYAVIPAGQNEPLPGSGEAPAQTAAVFAYLRDPDFFLLFAGYLKKLPPETDLYVGTDSRAKAAAIRAALRDCRAEPEVRCLNPAGSGLGALLIGFRDAVSRYDLFAFVHDELRNPQEYYTGMLTAVSDMWEAVLGGEDHVRGVLRLFGEDPYLGLLVPPLPVHGSYYHLLHHPWGLSFQRAQALLKELGIRRRADPDVPPVSFGNIFWCRREALRQLLDARWEYRMFSGASFSVLEDSTEHAAAKILPHIAQENGFFTRILSGPEKAGDGFLNCIALLRELTGRLQRRFPGDYGVTPGQFLDRIAPERGDDVLQISCLTGEEVGFAGLDRKNLEIRGICRKPGEDSVMLTCMLRDRPDGEIRVFVRDPYDRVFVSGPVLLPADSSRQDRGPVRICLPYRLFRFEEMPCRIGILCRQEAWFAQRRVRPEKFSPDPHPETVDRRTAAGIRIRGGDTDRKADGNRCAVRIETFGRREDCLIVEGYAYVRDRYHFDYEPELLLCADGGDACSFRTHRVERLDLAAAEPGYPYLRRAGFCSRPFTEDLERGHAYTVMIRLCHVHEAERSLLIRTECRFYY